ncbi:MAG: sodium:proton antiporter [Pirellulales bacterium]
MDDKQRLMVGLAGILVLGIGSQWTASRIRVPAILLLLIVGCLAGSVSGLLRPDEMFGELLSPIVSLSVGLILFEGGMHLKFAEIRGAWRPLIGLLTVGVAVTWCAVTLAAIYVLQMRPSAALVLGAILTVTGPTVIGPLLREIRPIGRVGTISKWEGITIDPIGATLALLVFEAIDSIQRAEFGSATASAAHGLLVVAIAGTIIGLVAAAVIIAMLHRFWIPEFLQNPVVLTLVVLAYTSAEVIHHEAGLLAVTVMGIALANQTKVDLHRLIEFKESLVVLLISVLFIILSARVPLSSLASFGWRGVAFAAALILVVRPLSVWAATIGSGLTFADRMFLSWMAPRGIVAASVSSVFAIEMGEAGQAIAPATLIVIFATVTVYGLTSGRLARRLGLAAPNAQGLLIAGANQTARAIARVLTAEGFPVVLVDSRMERVRKARQQGLNVHHASILSEQVLDDIDFGGLGRFLAITSNDEVNGIAAARFREVFGQENVYRITPATPTGTRPPSKWSRQLAGRTLFADHLTYDKMDQTLDFGGGIKVTRLTAEFGLEDYRKHYGELADPLFVIDGQRLIILVPTVKLTAKAGQQIVSLVSVAPVEPPPQTVILKWNE